jgi:hypothetical protein
VTTAARIDLRRPRSVSEVGRATLGLYRYYPWLFLVLAAAVIVPYDLLRLVITGNGPIAHARHHAGVATSWALFFLSLSIVGPIISALHAHALVLIGEAKEPRVASVARQGLAVLPQVALTVTIVAVVVNGILFAPRHPAFVYVLAYCVSVFLWVRFCVVAQIASVERTSAIATLRTSWKLTRRNGWHVLVVLILIYAVAYGVTAGTRVVTPGSGSGAEWVLLGLGVDTVIASFVALATAVLYFDLVARAARIERVETEAATMATEHATPSRAVARRGPREWAAILLVLLGGLPFGLGWALGVAMLWSSRAWSVRDKLVGTFVVPGGLGFLPFWVAFIFDAVGPARNLAAVEKVAVLLVVAVFAIAPVVTSVFLARRAASRVA